MPDQATVNTIMREHFAGLEVDAVSKIISPHSSKNPSLGTIIISLWTLRMRRKRQT